MSTIPQGTVKPVYQNNTFNGGGVFDSDSIPVDQIDTITLHVSGCGEQRTFDGRVVGDPLCGPTRFCATLDTTGLPCGNYVMQWEIVCKTPPTPAQRCFIPMSPESFEIESTAATPQETCGHCGK